MKYVLSCASAMAFFFSHAAVQAGDFFFKSPTGNINCIYSDYDAKPEIRCDILQFTPSFKTVPAGTSNEVMTCTPAKLRGFTITPTAKSGSAFCPTDAAIGADALVLNYGNSWSRGGLTCMSETSGMTCVNTAGRGFSLSRAVQKIF